MRGCGHDDLGFAVRSPLLRWSRLAPASAVQVSLQLCDEAVDHDDGSEPKDYSPEHVADQHTLGAPVGTQGDERDCAKGCSPPVQNRGVLRTAERVARRIANE